MPPELFSDAANPNPDPVARLGKKADLALRDLELARTIGDDATAKEAEWRLNLCIDAIAQIYADRARHAAGGPVSGVKAYLVGEDGPELFVPRDSGEIVPG
jgi:hypothetical protein